MHEVNSRKKNYKNQTELSHLTGMAQNKKAAALMICFGKTLFDIGTLHLWTLIQPENWSMELGVTVFWIQSLLLISLLEVFFFSLSFFFVFFKQNLLKVCNYLSTIRSNCDNQFLAHNSVFLGSIRKTSSYTFCLLLSPYVYACPGFPFLSSLCSLDAFNTHTPLLPPVLLGLFSLLTSLLREGLWPAALSLQEPEDPEITVTANLGLLSLISASQVCTFRSKEPD